jgi:hypothetical protein
MQWRFAVQINKNIIQFIEKTNLLLDPTKFISEMATKGIWNAVLGLPPVAHKIDFATYLSCNSCEVGWFFFFFFFFCTS